MSIAYLIISQDYHSLRSCFVSAANYVLHTQTSIQFKASVAKPWTKLRLVVYTCNYHPGTVLSGSWHPKRCLARAFLITLITLLIPCAALLLITSWERASGKQANTQKLRKQNLKSSNYNPVDKTDQMQIWIMHLLYVHALWGLHPCENISHIIYGTSKKY